MSVGIDKITVSFDGYSPDYFEKYRPPLKYNNILNNIQEMVEIKNDNSFGTQLVLNAVYSDDRVSNSDVENFKEFWTDKSINLNLQKLHDWHGYVPAKKYEYKNIVCRDIFEYMTINWDGSVVPCCLDYNGTCILGDAKKKHIKDIWFGKEFVSFRRLLLKDMKTFDMCKQCGYRIYNVNYPYITSFRKMFNLIVSN